MAKDELPPNINEYLEQINDNIPIDSKGLDELYYKIRASTGLEMDAIKIIVQSFFQEIRNQLLKGNTIFIKSFGKMMISSPKNGTKKSVFIKFKPSNNFLSKLK